MRTYTESKRIRPDILTAALYWSVAILMAFCVVSNRIIGDKGAFFVAAPFALLCFFYCALILACQKAVYVMVRLRTRRSQYLNAESNMETSLRIFGASAVASALIVAFAGFSFSEKLFGAPRGVFQILIACVAVALMGAQGVLRGYLQGIGYTKPILISDLIIAVVSFLSGMILTAVMYNYGLLVNGVFHVDEYSAVYGSSGMMFGFLIGILAGLIQIVISYQLRKGEIREFVKSGAPRYLDNKNDVLSGYKVIILMYVTPALAVLVDEAYYVMHTRRVHEDVDFITNYGIYSGKILSTITLFTLLCCIPFIKFWNRVMARIERDELEGARDRFKRLIHYASLLVFPVGIFILAIPTTVTNVLFGKGTELSDQLMMIAGVCVVAATVAVFFSWLLNHMGRSFLIILNVGVGWGIHVVLLVLLVTVLDLGVHGILTALLVAILGYDVLCAVILFRLLKLKRSILKMLLPPLFSSAGAGFVVFLINMLLVEHIGNLLTMLLCVVVFFAVYMVLLIVTRGVKTDELGKIPLGFLFKGLAANIQHDRFEEE